MPDTFFLNPGQSLRSRSETFYKVIQLLGVGGNAATFLVSATSGLNKGVLFALKVFRKVSREDRRESFLREMEFLKTCSHPAVMRVVDDGLFKVSERRTHPFIVAEYLPRTLETVQREGSASVVQKLSYATQLISALCYLDSLTPKVVHRDIKPQNIFVTGGSCVLGDFGLLKAIDGEDEDDVEIFKKSTGPGMPFFYPTPDLVSYARNEDQLSTKSDVFQLGLTLCFMFTGRNPVRQPRESYGEVQLDSIGHVPGALGRRIATLLRRMLVLSPDARESASQLLDPWMSVFNDAVTRAVELEGRAF